MKKFIELKTYSVLTTTGRSSSCVLHLWPTWKAQIFTECVFCLISDQAYSGIDRYKKASNMCLQLLFSENPSYFWILRILLSSLIKSLLIKSLIKCYNVFRMSNKDRLKCCLMMVIAKFVCQQNVFGPPLDVRKVERHARHRKSIQTGWQVKWYSFHT